VRIESSHTGKEELVRLLFDRKGSFMRARLPTLAIAPDVLQMSSAWLKAKMGGEPYQQSFPRSDLFLEALLKR
jgi:hypothetical protein